MFFIIGFIVVIGSVIGGYVMHHGKLEVLWQPNEVLIIFGAAVGSFLISSPAKLIKDVCKSLGKVLKGSPYKKKHYVELLTMIGVLLKTIRSKGMLEVESHIENPSASSIFGLSPAFLKNHHAVHFTCDYLRIMTMGLEDYYQIEELMERDMEVAHKEKHEISSAIITMADAMPALGIVAAVLGVIITMGSITEPPEILGALIGAALVGTFLGVLLSYGFIAPMGRNIGTYYEDEHKFTECIKIALLAHLKGNAPVISVEFARNCLPSHEKPTFLEVEEALNSAPNPAAKA